ncbi:PepSY-associated TM helix domain-containing protein [Novosphingobium subterraneum]|uniref:PepSY domain-containing protein n=1 Tax=Novosphingobium subterraneum TaxID=48936 RepID=A0A0B8ZZT6_9SPHN|nr:PepSY-associated TM helix domain-containing protein [Novosphingobium subterraneum]KHS43851.1 hypothetical protein NJ75_03471 [Novosphingobium subterraneum]
MKMRRWHRWFGLPSAILLGFIALTGTLLHVDMIRLGQKPPGSDHGIQAPPRKLPSDAELEAMVGTLAATARSETDFAVRSLQINLDATQVTLVAAEGLAPGSKQIKIDARTGKRIIEPPRPADFHIVLQDLHAGYTFGWAGRIVSLLCGIALVVLSVTGFQIWWDLRKRRKNREFFWK